MPFGFGGSKSKSSGTSQSTSSSQSTAANLSTSGSVSGGFSRGGSENLSSGFSRDTIAFDDVFQRLYGGAESVIPSLDASSLTRAANQLFTGGTNFLNSLEGGTGYLQGRLSGQNPELENQIGLLGEDIGEFLREEINPAIQGNAIMAGQLGGGRQGVAQGQAAEAAIEEFRRGASGLRYQDVASRDAIAQGLVGQQGQGLSAIPGLAAVADMGFGAALSPYERLAGILGGPMALTESGSFGKGTSFQTAQDFARAYSEAIGQSQSSSRSQSTSKTKSKGGSFSIGGIEI